MIADPVSIPAENNIRDLIETYFYRYTHKAFPVTQDGRLAGGARLGDVGRVAPGDRAHLTAGDLAALNGIDATVRLDTSVLDALKIMRDQDTSQLMVNDNGALRGMLSLRDILN